MDKLVSKQILVNIYLTFLARKSCGRVNYKVIHGYLQEVLEINIEQLELLGHYGITD